MLCTFSLEAEKAWRCIYSCLEGKGEIIETVQGLFLPQHFPYVTFNKEELSFAIEPCLETVTECQDTIIT